MAPTDCSFLTSFLSEVELSLAGVTIGVLFIPTGDDIGCEERF